MPWGLLDVADEEFDVRYRARLDRLDLDALAAKFDSLSARHGGRRLVLLCFEDVHAGQSCHRRIFADYWTERTGIAVPEWEPEPPAQLQLTDQKGTTP
jgi:hypothetical protein